MGSGAGVNNCVTLERISVSALLASDASKRISLVTLKEVSPGWIDVKTPEFPLTVPPQVMMDPLVLQPEAGRLLSARLKGVAPVKPEKLSPREMPDISVRVALKPESEPLRVAAISFTVVFELAAVTLKVTFRSFSGVPPTAVNRLVPPLPSILIRAPVTLGTTTNSAVEALQLFDEEVP